MDGSLSYDELRGISVVNGRLTNPAQIADAIKSNPNYIEGAGMLRFLLGRLSGTAQQLANELGAPVFAPNRPMAWSVTKSNWVFDTDEFPANTALPHPEIKAGWRMLYPGESK